MTLIYCTASIMIFAAIIGFTWAAFRFFKIDNAEALKGKKIVSFAGSIQSAAIAFSIFFPLHQNLVLYFFALLLALLSNLIFWSAININRENRLHFAFSSAQPDFIVTDGPYRYVRHPFYLAYSLTWISSFLLTANPFLILTGGFLIFLYVKAAIQEEKRFLNGPFSQKYSAYKKQAGMFLPKTSWRDKT